MANRLLFLVALLFALPAHATWVTDASDTMADVRTQTVYYHEWLTGTTTDSNTISVANCDRVEASFDPSTGDASTDATVVFINVRNSDDKWQSGRPMNFVPSNEGAYYQLNASKGYIIAHPLTAPSGDTARATIRCTTAPVETGGRARWPAGGSTIASVLQPSDSYESASWGAITRMLESMFSIGGGGSRKWSPLDGDGVYSRPPQTAVAALAGCVFTYTAKAITGLTSQTPPVVTAVGHGYSSGQIVSIAGVLGAAGVAHWANGGPYKITVTGADTFTLQDLSGANIVGTGGIARSSGGVVNTSETPDTTQVNLLSDSNGACGTGGTTEQLCGCGSDPQEAAFSTGNLFPLTGSGFNYPIMTFRHMSSGADAGAPVPFSYGVADWVGPWGKMAASTAGNCTQEQWVNHTGHYGDPYLPIAQQTMAMGFRIGLSNLVEADMSATIAFWGFVESGNTDILIDPAATTAAGAIKGITEGGGILWQGFKFSSISVRGGVEYITTLLDLTNQTTRDDFRTARRSILNAIQKYEMIAPAQAGGVSFIDVAHYVGFQPIGGSAGAWTRDFTVTGRNDALSVPSGTPTATYTGLIPVVTACASTANAWVTGTSYVAGQRVTNGGNTYVALIDHVAPALFTTNQATNWLINAGTADAYFGTIALGTVEHGS